MRRRDPTLVHHSLSVHVHALQGKLPQSVLSNVSRDFTSEMMQVTEQRRSKTRSLGSERRTRDVLRSKDSKSGVESRKEDADALHHETSM